MTRNATERIICSLAVVLMAAAWTGTASGQADPLGDEFIYFVNGVNVLVPNFTGTVIEDPANPSSGDQVAAHQTGNFNHSGFEWVRAVGRDASANAGLDTLYFDIWSDTSNASEANMSIMLTDITDDSGANDGSADLEFRLQWPIPQSMHDGQWHSVALALPPATWQGLDDAKIAGTLTGLDSLWTYAGSWSVGGFGVAMDGLGPNTTMAPELWSEFQWDAIYKLGPFWDNDQHDGGPIYLDDVYIGTSATDLGAANDPGPAMTGVSFSADGAENLISWSPNPSLGGYQVYASESAISDPVADGVQLLSTIAASDGINEFRHAFELPHPSFAGTPFHYAVTSLSQFGVENTDVSASAGSVANDNLATQPYIIQLTDAEATTLFDNLAAGTVSADGFPDITPFTVNAAHSSLGDGTVWPRDDSDLSATVRLGYSDLNELFIYTEVVDDTVGTGPSGTPGSDAWQYDSVEFGWGNYDVRDVPGGSILTGSPHLDFERGAFADYQFRLAVFTDVTGAITGTTTFVAGSIDGEVQGGSTEAEFIIDGTSGDTTGYRMLSLYPLNAIQDLTQNDAVLDPPASDEIRVVPFNIALNDDDGDGRAHQIQWSTKANADGQWWNTPAQWPGTAMAGRSFAVANEEVADVPQEFVLQQNYPNPFAKSTAIRFSLPAADDVTISVFDVLGRRVATVVNNELMGAGSHQVVFDGSGLASGVYLYRLESGDTVVKTNQMMLVK